MPKHPINKKLQGLTDPKGLLKQGGPSGPSTRTTSGGLLSSSAGGGQLAKKPPRAAARGRKKKVRQLAKAGTRGAGLSPGGFGPGKATSVKKKKPTR